MVWEKKILPAEKHIEKFSHYGKKTNICLIFPSDYSIGIANTGHQTVYRILNNMQEINCERYYFDNRLPLHKSIETSKSIFEFDIIAFSCCYELDIPAIEKFYTVNNIDIKKVNERPLIIAGGALTFINPLMIRDIADLVFLGDFEENAEGFREAVLELRTGKKIDDIREKYDFFLNLNFLKIKSSRNIEAYSCIVSDKSAFPDSMLIELCRGCCCQCNFCNTGHSRNPLRFIKKNLLEILFEKAISNGVSKIGFIGTAVLSYPGLIGILENLLTANLKFSFSSINTNQITNDFLNILFRAGQNTITLAPEAGNDKMLGIINKKIVFDELISTSRYAAEIGIKRLKLYFIYGFEEEEANDLDDIANLILKIKKATNISGKPFNIAVSFNPFIPKPDTPFANRKMLHKNILEKKRNYIRDKLIKTGVRLEFMSINDSIKQHEISFRYK